MRDPDFKDDLDDYRRYGEGRVPRRKKRKLNIWQRMSRVMEVVIYILIILVVAKLFSPELDRQRDLQKEHAKLEAIKLEKEKKVARLRREHNNLVSDRNYMEAVARDRLNLQREGEYVIQIEGR